ncbi:hypothetical protein AK812_SmicGene13401 [Symbiodinium microadriaticum]|uniref:RAP domain-containing protein n=1 Tax=Symbiodinium microadriaticum TaxID=2951 RepID=A0A1Q9E891_SYMMI|nr:hypothetical protein AK812_SmicGene13401 [Symbiodinium microadriaticum]
MYGRVGGQEGKRYYPLLSRMLKPLLEQPVPDVTTLLRCIKAYHWAGYHQQTNFYSHFAAVLAQSAPGLSPEELVEACSLFAGATQYQDRFYHAAEQRVLSKDISEFTPHQLSLIAHAFTVHLVPFHDVLLSRIAEVVEKQAMDMEPRDIVRCLSAFHRAVLYFPGAVEAGLAACSVPLFRSWLLRKPSKLRCAEVAELLESAAFFGVETDLVQVALDYLTDRVDEVTERASIQVVFAMCLTGTVATHSKLLLFLFRKIGAGSAWESHRLRVFHLWVSQLMQFPWLDARMKRRCIDAGLRAWCLHRRGYGCPHPEEARDVSAELQAMGVQHRTFVAVQETPYEVDIALGPGKYALLVASETARNTLTPVGSTLLQMKHLKDRGWRCLVVPRRAWLLLESGPKGQGPKAHYLRALLEGFLPPSAPLLTSDVPKTTPATSVASGIGVKSSPASVEA